MKRGPVVSLEPHPGACSLESLYQYARKLDGPLAVDLFCGAGGLSLGLQEAGFNVILGVDTFCQAIETHRAYFPGASVVGDLSEPRLADELSRALKGLHISVVAGGPPCQPFSRAGRSKIRSLAPDGKAHDDDRKELWRGFVEVVSKVQPDAVLVENVPDFALGHDSIAFRRLVVALESQGYTIHSRILPTWRFGVPQHRQRLIIVGVRENFRFRWPRATRKESRSLRDAISDLPVVRAGSRKARLRYRGPRNHFQKSLRAGVRDGSRGHVQDHIARPVRPDDLEAFKRMRHGTLYSDLPARLRRYRSDIFDDKYHRLHWDKPCRTITAHLAHDGYWYIHPTQHRSLTVREAARVQTFPDRVRFAGHPSHAYRQIGEAVPPLLAKLVGAALLRALQSPQNDRCSRTTTIGLSSSLSDWFSRLPEDQLAAPWRRGDSTWLVLLGFVVLGRASRSARAESWSTLRDRWPNPTCFQDDEARRLALEEMGRGSRLKLLEALATELAETEEAVDGSGWSVRGLSRDRVELARAVLGQGDHRPVTVGATRVAERILGRSAENSRMHAQLLISLVVGPDPTGRAYAGLLELGDTVCGPQNPECRQCELIGCCAYKAANS